jgi:hypothetical protein
VFGIMNSIARQHERSDATRVFIDVDQPFSLTEPVEQTVPIVACSNQTRPIIASPIGGCVC